jgi:hypothetical protein
MNKYLEKVKSKINRFAGVIEDAIGPSKDEAPTNKSIFSFGRSKVLRKPKMTNDVIEDFTRIYQLRSIEELNSSHSELIKAYKSKIEEIKQEVSRYAEDRKREIKHEHQMFLEAKQKGTRALIQYKLSKAKFHKKLTLADLKMAQDYTQYKNSLEEAMAYEKLKIKYGAIKMTQESRVGSLDLKNVESKDSRPFGQGYMYVSNTGSKAAQIIAAGNNYEVAKHELKLLEQMDNILNRMLTKLQPKDLDQIRDLKDSFIDINRKLHRPVETSDLAKVGEPSVPISTRKTVLEYEKSMIRIAKKHLIGNKNLYANTMYQS